MNKYCVYIGKPWGLCRFEIDISYLNLFLVQQSFFFVRFLLRSINYNIPQPYGVKICICALVLNFSQTFILPTRYTKIVKLLNYEEIITLDFKKSIEVGLTAYEFVI